MVERNTVRASRLAAQLCLMAAPGFLFGCDRHPPNRTRAMPAAMAAPAPAPSPPSAGRTTPWFTASPQQGPGIRLAYTHRIGLEVASAALPDHFTAARDRCLTMPALHCVLLRAALADEPFGDDGPPLRSASLQVRLPHDQVAPFANALTENLPGEQPGSVHLVRQSTEAVDLAQPVADMTQRVSQLTDYLNSLKSMGGRLTISVSDLVKIASETAQAQTEIEEAQSQQRNLALRVDTEELDVDFQPVAVHTNPDPIAATLAHARDTFRSSLADALRTAIEAAPWIPLALLGLLLLALLRVALIPRRRLPPV